MVVSWFQHENVFVYLSASCCPTNTENCCSGRSASNCWRTVVGLRIRKEWEGIWANSSYPALFSVVCCSEIRISSQKVLWTAVPSYGDRISNIIFLLQYQMLYLL